MSSILAGVALAAAAFAAIGWSSADGTDADRKAGSAIVPPALPQTKRQLASFAGAPATIVALARNHGGVPVLRAAGAEPISPSLALWLLKGPRTVAVLEELRRLDALRYVEADVAATHPEDHWLQGDPLLDDQAELDTIGAGLEPPGPGVPVTVIDSGVDMLHPEFAGRPDTYLLNRQSTPVAESEDHGTAVASVVAAPANGIGMVGVYPRARLHVYDTGEGTCSSDARSFAVAWRAARRGVINTSWSYGEGKCFALRDAVAEAFGVGSVVVASAGNQGDEGNPLREPASLNHVLTVAATDVDDVPMSFSNRNLAVDLAAPGKNILVAIPHGFSSERYGPGALYDFMDGTSFSAPMVAAAAAWVWTVRPDLDRTQLFNVMRYSARDVYDEGYDSSTGFGVLDIAAALDEETPLSDPREPNDDIYQVKADGLFSSADPPLTSPSRTRRELRAALDIGEDPVDVYRALVPARGKLTVTVSPDDGENVDLEIFRRSAKTVYYKSRARALRGPLVAGSYREGARTEQLTVENDGRAGEVVYVAVYLPKDGPLDAAYRLVARTHR